MSGAIDGVSLVMATLGRSEEVGRFIDALAAQTDPAFELIIVDQNPDERLVPIVAAAVARRLPVRHERIARRGLSNARNHGLQFARFEIVGFPDDDCWYEEDVIERLRAVFGAYDGPEGVSARWVEAEQGAAVAARTFSLADWRRFRTDNAASITLFFRREVCRSLGGFDTRLGVGEWFGVGEETDFMMRVLAGGALVRKQPGIRVHHHYGAPAAQPRSVSFRNARRRSRGTGALYVKHCLPLWVILRGLSGPLRPLLKLDWEGGWLGVAVVLGRVEGIVRWTFSAGQQPNS